ncbi:MAG: PAS domain S-box protein [Prolixibacteraceae bacterium]|nr:PAS domain S-box protein [Prolixibacteraceae bacterium]
MVKILAIDENNDNLNYLKAIIGGALPDTEFYAAPSVQEGIGLALKHDPDVILLDGFEVCRLLKQNQEVGIIPVVFFMASAGHKADRIKALDAGAEAFLTYPVDQSELAAQIKAMAKIKLANRQMRNEKELLANLVAERTRELELSQAETLKLHNLLSEETKMRQKIDVELAEKGKQLQNIFELHTAVKLIIDPISGMIVDANRAAETFYGWTKEQLRQMRIQEINLLPEEEVKKAMEKAMKENHNYFEFMHRQSNGSIRNVEVFSSHIEVKGRILLHSIVHDITKSKEAEAWLKANEESVSLLNKLTSEMLEIQDLDGMYRYIVSNLQKRNPDTIILYNSIDEKSNVSRLEIISGLENSRWNKILRIAGFNPLGKKYELIPVHTDYFRSGKFVEFEGGLVEFAASELSPVVSRTIEKIIGLNKIYTIGIIKNTNLLAAIHFFTFNNKVITDIDFIETMVKQAGILLQKKMAEQALKENEDKYRRLAESMKDVVWTLDAESLNYIYISPSVTNLRGYTPEEVMAEPLDAAMIPPYQTQVREEIRERTIDLLAGRISPETYFINEARQRCKDGSLVWTEIITHLLLNQLNDKVEVHGVTRDITDRKKAETDLRESEARLKRAELTSKSGNWELHLDSQQVIASEGAKKIYGIDKGELGYSVVTEIPLPEYRPLLDEALVNLLKDNQPYDVEFKIKTVNTGEIKDIHSVALHDKEKRVLFGVIQDITKRKQAEDALKESETRLRELNATKDKFFSIIAHDLKSPFNSILGLSNILVEQIREKNYEGIDEYARIILVSSQRTMDLLMNLLEWSRSQTGRMEFSPEYVEIVALINEVVELLYDYASQKTITIVKKLPRNMVVFADRAMISTILRNLISNAIKFTHTRGQIIISVTQEENKIIVSVTDNGIGMKTNVLEKLFRIDESHTTLGTQNEKGTGLGLLLCKEFIEKHGGEIWIESTPGTGSTFSFSIPKN